MHVQDISPFIALTETTDSDDFGINFVENVVTRIIHFNLSIIHRIYIVVIEFQIKLPSRQHSFDINWDIRSCNFLSLLKHQLQNIAKYFPASWISKFLPKFNEIRRKGSVVIRYNAKYNARRSAQRRVGSLRNSRSDRSRSVRARVRCVSGNLKGSRASKSHVREPRTRRPWAAALDRCVRSVTRPL